MKRENPESQVPRPTKLRGRPAVPRPDLLEMSDELDRPAPGINSSPRSVLATVNTRLDTADNSPEATTTADPDESPEMPTLVEACVVTPEQLEALRQRAAAILVIGALKVARGTAGSTPAPALDSDLDLPERVKRR